MAGSPSSPGAFHDFAAKFSVLLLPSSREASRLRFVVAVVLYLLSSLVVEERAQTIVPPLAPFYHL
jgi:hypothetical protein